MKLKSPLSNEIGQGLQKLAGGRVVCVLSELYAGGGTDVSFLAGELEIRVIKGLGDFTIGLKLHSNKERESSVVLARAFFEKINDLDAIEKMFNSYENVSWFLTNFEKIYSLFGDPSNIVEKQQFFDFQTRLYNEWSEKNIRSFTKAKIAVP